MRCFCHFFGNYLPRHAPLTNECTSFLMITLSETIAADQLNHKLSSYKQTRPNLFKYRISSLPFNSTPMITCDGVGLRFSKPVIMFAVMKNGSVLILSDINILKSAKAVRVVHASTKVVFILVLHASFDFKAQVGGGTNSHSYNSCLSRVVWNRISSILSKVIIPFACLIAGSGDLKKILIFIRISTSLNFIFWINILKCSPHILKLIPLPIY